MNKPRCAICREQIVRIWFESPEMARSHGLCFGCMIKYIDHGDNLMTLKMDLRGAIVSALPKIEPKEALEEWEDDLFD